MQRTLQLIGATLCVAGIVAAEPSTRELEKLGDELESRLDLLTEEVDCGFEDVLFFNVETNVVPADASLLCSDNELFDMGIDINLALFDVGIGEQQVGGARFIGGVCPEHKLIAEFDETPKTLPFHNSDRKLNPHGYIWTGGGVSSCCLVLRCVSNLILKDHHPHMHSSLFLQSCRYCSGDDDDRRSLMEALVEAPESTFKAEFEDTLGPEIEVKVEALLTDKYLNDEKKYRCLGAKFDITVKVTVVYLWQLDLQCQNYDIVANLGGF